MKCPRSTCQSEDIGTKDTRKSIPNKFGGLNMSRRKRICNKCKQPFYTVEITEADFDKYFDKPEAIKVAGY